MKIEIMFVDMEDHAYCYIPFLDQYIYGKDLSDVKSAVNSMNGKKIGKFTLIQGK